MTARTSSRAAGARRASASRSKRGTSARKPSSRQPTKRKASPAARPRRAASRRKTERLPDPPALRRVARRGGDTLHGVVSLPQRLDDFIRPLARAVGWLGCGMLLVCAVLAAIPAERWPTVLDPDQLPFYFFVSLTVASLLGWSLLREGAERVGRRLPGPTRPLLLLVVPFVCLVLGLLHPDVIDLRTLGDHDVLWHLARWYPPALAGLFMIAFLVGRARPGQKVKPIHGIQAALLMTPFALLLLVIAFGVEAPFIAEPMQETLAILGAHAAGFHVLMSYFVGDQGT